MAANSSVNLEKLKKALSDREEYIGQVQKYQAFVKASLGIFKELNDMPDEYFYAAYNQLTPKEQTATRLLFILSKNQEYIDSTNYHSAVNLAKQALGVGEQHLGLQKTPKELFLSIKPLDKSFLEKTMSINFEPDLGFRFNSRVGYGSEAPKGVQDFILGKINKIIDITSIKKHLLDKSYKAINSSTDIKDIKPNEEIKKKVKECLDEYSTTKQANEDCFIKIVIDSNHTDATRTLIATATNELLGQTKQKCYQDNVFAALHIAEDEYKKLDGKIMASTDACRKQIQAVENGVKLCEYLISFPTNKDAELNRDLSIKLSNEIYGSLESSQDSQQSFLASGEAQPYIVCIGSWCL